jgi:hypothetical protein
MDRARSSPAITRSRIIDLSNSETMLNMPNKARPEWRRGIECPLLQVEIDATHLQFTKQADQIGL